MQYILYYFGIGYIINNILALLALYGSDEGQWVEVDIGNFIVTIPAWPYTLFTAIEAIFSKED